MKDRSNQTRRSVLKAIGAAGALVGTASSAHASGFREGLLGVGTGDTTAVQFTPSDRASWTDPRTLEWGGQGSENATQDCEGGVGYWHWVLTPGGRTAIDLEAELTVTFDDETETTVSGYRPGQGGGAVHFDVYREDGGTVESAAVTFTGGGERPVLTISDGECTDEEVPPENGEQPEVDPEYWQVDFGEGTNPPLPPHYWPDDGMWGLGNAEDGVTGNPSGIRRETVGQLADVDVVGKEFQFDDAGDPSEVTVEFEVQEGGEPRSLHLALFEMPGPFDPDEVEDQELIDAISDEFSGGDSGSLTLSIPAGTSPT